MENDKLRGTHCEVLLYSLLVSKCYLPTFATSSCCYYELLQLLQLLLLPKRRLGIKEWDKR